MASGLHATDNQRNPALDGNGRLARIAAVGDIHLGRDSKNLVRPALIQVGQLADMLLIAGDLTQHGTAEEGRILAEELHDLPVPTAAVLGNHDYHLGAEDEIRRALEEVGVVVLEAESVVFDIHGIKVGVAGAKGFGGGFAGACATEFGEGEMKAFVRHTKYTAHRLREVLDAMVCDVRIALMHYAPVKATLMGERPEIYPFLGSYLLGEAVDMANCDLALHGHAHRGIERGLTKAGVPVRNVARPVINHAFKVYKVSPHEAAHKVI